MCLYLNLVNHFKLYTSKGTSSSINPWLYRFPRKPFSAFRLFSLFHYSIYSSFPPPHLSKYGVIIGVLSYSCFIFPLSFTDFCFPFIFVHLNSPRLHRLLVPPLDSSQLPVAAMSFVCTVEVSSCLLAFSHSPTLRKPHPFYIIPIPFIVAVLPLIGSAYVSFKFSAIS